MKNTNALDDVELERVIGGAAVPAYVQGAVVSSKVCGKYFARDGRDGETPDCSFCIHSKRNAMGLYSCALDM